MTALVLLITYLVCVTGLALRPLEVLWVSPANLEPFATIRADIARGPAEAGRTVGAGLLRLAPLGVLLPLLGRRLGGPRFTSFRRTVFVGGMLSLALEFWQSLLPSRVADVDSIILNTAGVALAHLLCYGPLRAATARGPRASSSRGTARVCPHLVRRRPRGQVRQARRVWASLSQL
ncbi:VanZ family protein [Streptomyces sp. NBC_01803]|uniref:VanZ family protein n=1 Tax=Streptomyces sp. NBC_01803 TaxID=2975946 RepID=UPI002DD97DC2|nr:VanZ family protein [Streptomyces sp. NBC_01803]WSA45899.1 VanZ family protein [Streptomyces sp. NBC_01803]